MRDSVTEFIYTPFVSLRQLVEKTFFVEEYILEMVGQTVPCINPVADTPLPYLRYERSTKCYWALRYNTQVEDFEYTRTGWKNKVPVRISLQGILDQLEEYATVEDQPDAFDLVLSRVEYLVPQGQSLYRVSFRKDTVHSGDDQIFRAEVQTRKADGVHPGSKEEFAAKVAELKARGIRIDNASLNSYLKCYEVELNGQSVPQTRELRNKLKNLAFPGTRPAFGVFEYGASKKLVWRNAGVKADVE